MATSNTKPTLAKPIVDSEEDLDDLDDVLSEFDSVKAPVPSSSSISSPPPPPPPTAAATGSSSSGTTSTSITGGGPKGRLRTNTRVDAPPESIPGPIKKSKAPAQAQLGSTAEEDEGGENGEDDGVLSSDDFARELAREMENLVREIAGESQDVGAGASGSGGDGEEERARAFKAAWEAMLVEGMNANMGLGEDGLPADSSTSGQASGNTAGTSSGSGAAAPSFQDKIKQTMDKLKESESKFQGAPGSGDLPADTESLQELLKSLGDLGLGGDGEGGEGGEGNEDLAGFLESMMGQLMSKEVLYEPLKELADNFPPYLEKPPKPLSAEDRSRYNKQLVCVRRIIAVFEKEGYSDTDAECSKVVVDLMSEMQSYGTPPPEIMGPLPPGFDGTNPLLGGGGGADGDCTIA